MLHVLDSFVGGANHTFSPLGSVSQRMERGRTDLHFFLRHSARNVTPLQWCIHKGFLYPKEIQVQKQVLAVRQEQSHGKEKKET